MKINIQDITTNAFTLEVLATDAIDLVKHRIAKKACIKEIPFTDLTLIFNGVRLDDDSTL